MNVTKKFWAWLGQALTFAVFMARIDLVVGLLKLFPFCDMSQVYRLFLPLILLAVGWAVRLAWRAYVGFYRNMDFFNFGIERRS